LLDIKLELFTRQLIFAYVIKIYHPLVLSRFCSLEYETRLIQKFSTTELKFTVTAYCKKWPTST